MHRKTKPSEQSVCGSALGPRPSCPFLNAVYPRLTKEGCCPGRWGGSGRGREEERGKQEKRGEGCSPGKGEGTGREREEESSNQSQTEEGSRQGVVGWGAERENMQRGRTYMFSQGGGAGWCGAVAGGTRQAGSIIIARHAARVTARVVGVRPSDAVAPAGVGALARDRGGAMEGKQRGEWAAELHYSRLVCLRRATAVGAARIGGAAPSVSGGGAVPSGSATIMAGGRRAGLPLARWWPPRLAPPLVDAPNRPPPRLPSSVNSGASEHQLVLRSAAVGFSEGWPGGRGASTDLWQRRPPRWQRRGGV